MIRQRKNAGTSWDEKKKATQVKQTIQLEEIKQKVLVKEKNTKEISKRDKTIQTKQDIPKQRKKFLPATRERIHEDKSTTG